MNRICPHCKKKIDNSTIFCKFCGANVSRSLDELLIDIEKELQNSQKESQKTNNRIFAYTILTGGIAIIALFVAYIQILSSEQFHIPGESLFALGLIVVSLMILFACVILWTSMGEPIIEKILAKKK
jgi:hypothetical protein